MDTELTTTRDVIKALGGVPETAKLTGAKYGAAWMWTTAQKFPPRYFVVMSQALKQKGLHAPASLWGMVESEKAAS